MIDLSNYKTASRLSPHINAGASARLNQMTRECHCLDPEQRAAWLHGWDVTNEAENRAGRVIPVIEVLEVGDVNWPCVACGGGPVHCRECMVPA